MQFRLGQIWGKGSDPLASNHLRGLLNGVSRIRDMGANNRAENSHQPTRERERRRRRFRPACCEAQRFLSTFSPICNHFRRGRHLMSAHHQSRADGQAFCLSLVNCYFRLLLAAEIVRGNVAANRTDPGKHAAVPACLISPGACPH